MAEARKRAAEMDSDAKIRLAEGIRAEAAAEGLAEVEVRERGAEAITKVGVAEAEATSARLKAEAEGARLLSLATAEGTTAQASAEAAMIGEKLKAEAAGLTEKAAAMAALDDASRGHEEYRLRLAAEKDIRLAGLDTQRQIAEAQATVLATGLEKADISIVGGDTVFFDRLMGAVAVEPLGGHLHRQLRDRAVDDGPLDGRLLPLHRGRHPHPVLAGRERGQPHRLRPAGPADRRRRTAHHAASSNSWTRPARWVWPTPRSRRRPRRWPHGSATAANGSVNGLVKQ